MNYTEDVCKLCDIKFSRYGVDNKATTSGMINYLKNKPSAEYLKLQDMGANKLKISKRNVLNCLNRGILLIPKR